METTGRLGAALLILYHVALAPSDPHIALALAIAFAPPVALSELYKLHRKHKRKIAVLFARVAAAIRALIRLIRH